MDDLTRLPNIGPVLATKLAEIGVSSHDDLVAMGSVEAVLRIGHTDPSACYNMLYAIEGAIRGVRWHAIPRDERAQVRDQFDRARSPQERSQQ
jgi:DNA transformation protein